MATYTPITTTSHNTLWWRYSQDYSYATTDIICTLTAREMQKALLTDVIGFVAGHSGIVPVMLQGIEKGINLKVNANGVWTGRYIPQVYWHYPFKALKTDEGQYIVCADHDSGLINADSSGFGFFNGEGQPTDEYTKLTEQLAEFEAQKFQTGTIMEILTRYELFEPWLFDYEVEEKHYQISDLFQINEKTLKALSGDEMIELRDSGALLVAHCQLLSMQNVAGLLTTLYKQKAAAQIEDTQSESPVKGADKDYNLFDESGTISFDNL